MSAVLSESLATLAGDMMTGQIAPAYAAAQVRLMSQVAVLLEQEVNAFRMLEHNRALTRNIEAEAIRKLHELARMPDEQGFKPIRNGADIVTLHPKDGGRNDG